MTAEESLERLLARDASLWPDGNVSATRLGWLDSHERYESQLEELEAFSQSLDAQRVILLGMGGSSLGPLVLSRWSEGRPLEVLDTTAPDEIARATEDLSDAFILVSSKSGTTLEVECLLAHCWSKLPDPSRYAVVTDPGSALLDGCLSESRHFLNDPDIGGRYSVLSLFGLVPAVLTGGNASELIDGARDVDMVEAVAMGIEMAGAARNGRDKLTIVGPHEFGLWAEQLIAESTGKQGKGVIPVPVGDEAEGGPDRQHVEVGIGGLRDLGREFRRWMVATAIVGAELGIDPFDEPDVAAAKRATGQALADLPLPEVKALDPAALPEWLAAEVGEGDYVSFQAYLPFGFQTDLEDLRRRTRDLLRGAPVTAGFGPRFLHSTGQLHKGGPNSVVAVQIVPPQQARDLEIPDREYGFATLINAQAAGDLATLKDRGRRVVRVESSQLDALVPA